MLCPDCDGEGIHVDLSICERCKGHGELRNQPVTKTVVIRGGRKVEVTTLPRETR